MTPMLRVDDWLVCMTGSYAWAAAYTAVEQHTAALLVIMQPTHPVISIAPVVWPERHHHSFEDANGYPVRGCDSLRAKC